MRLKAKVLVRKKLALIISLFFGLRANAIKIDVMMGWFNVAAESTTRNEVSNFGLYRVNYMLPLLPKLDLSVGYSLMMSEVLGGDLGFGLDGALLYFPLSTSGKIQASSSYSTVVIDSIWRPYLGIGFSQRQFQSVQSSYAGFSVSVGLERSIARNFDLKGEIRYVDLQGARQSTATETSAVGGLIFLF